MKPAKQLVVTFACASLYLMSQASFAAPAGYKLVVRGGANVGLQVTGVNSDTVDLIVDFGFGQRPVGDGLSAGEGSWMDRGMRPGEPTRLIYRTRRANAQNIAASLRNPRVKWAFWCNNTGRGYMNVTGDVQVSGPQPVIFD